MNTSAKFATAVMGSALAISLAACGSSSSKTPSSSSSGSSSAATSAPAAAGSVVEIKNFKFTVPASVAPGAKITVKNDDKVAHTITSGKDFDVKVPGSGTATLTVPAKAGTYKLTCDYHPQMRGTLTVK